MEICRLYFGTVLCYVKLALQLGDAAFVFTCKLNRLGGQEDIVDRCGDGVNTYLQGKTKRDLVHWLCSCHAKDGAAPLVQCWLPPPGGPRRARVPPWANENCHPDLSNETDSLQCFFEIAQRKMEPSS